MLQDLDNDIVDSYLYSLKDTSFSEYPYLWDGLAAPNYIQDPKTHTTTRVFDNGPCSARDRSRGRDWPIWSRHFYDDKCWYKIINFHACPGQDNKGWLNTVGYPKAFLKAIEENFYEDVSLVNAFIYDYEGGNCIGYQMPIMNELPKEHNKNAIQGRPVYRRIPDNKKLDDLITRVTLKSKETGLVLTDFGGFNHSNIMEFEDRYYAIDLEGITTLRIWANDNVRGKHFKNCYPAYVDGVKKI